MASFQKRTNGDGSKAIIAWVRVRPFKPASKSFSTMAEAKAWATALEEGRRKERKAGDVRPELESLTLTELINAYITDPVTQTLKEIHGRTRLLDWWIAHFGGEKVRTFGPLKLREARDLLNNGREPATVNRYLGALRSCWSWGQAAQYIPMEKGWPKKLMLPEPSGRIRFLDDDELQAVLDAAEKAGPWMHAAVLVSLGTGLRQGELRRLEWKDVDFDKKTVTVMLGKNTTGGPPKRRTVHLPSPAVDALKKLRRDGVVGPKHIFPNDDGNQAGKFYLAFRWRRVRKAAGLVDFRWHDLRHSCASYLAQAGASLLEIGAVLGHSSPGVTARYAHLVSGKPVTGSAALAAKLGAKL
jgi:integrase